MRQKSRNFTFILSLVLTFFVLAMLTPMIFNFKDFFGVGYHRTDEDIRIDYIDGYGELNMDVQLEFSRGDFYSYYLSCYFSSSFNVEIIGITHLNYTVKAKGSIVSHRTYDWDPPFEQYARESRTILKKSEEFVWSGYAEVKFISESTIKNETIEFNLSITILVGNQDYSNIDLISYVAFFSWIFAFLVIPITLKFIIQPQFGVPFDAEARKKQKEYFDYLKKYQEE